MTDLLPTVDSKPGRDWRDSVRLATDLALLGMLMTGAALPLVTAGGAVATASFAIRHYLAHDAWPGATLCRRVFRRALLPGLLRTLALGLAVLLVVVDLRALSAGQVPGGPPLMVLTVAVALAALGHGGLVLVGAGARGPRAVASAAGVIALAAVLSLLIHPVLAPVLAGYTLFALHVLARRHRAVSPGTDRSTLR
jgi:hypothetical protein